MDGTVVQGPAEAVGQLPPAPRPKPQAESPHRAWARRERQAHDAWLEAVDSGKPQLIERTRLTLAQVRRERPGSSRRRRTGRAQ